MTMKKKNWQILLITLAFIASGAAYYVYNEYNRKGIDLSNAQPAFAVTVPEIIQAFRDNEQAGNKKFLSRTVEISGEIKQIDQDEKGNSTFVLGDTASMSSVRCSMDSSAMATAALFKTGQKITLKGICTGYIADDMGIGADVILTHCLPQKK